jgi:hypothetical protein
MILEEGSPALRWRLALAHQILADAGFAHIDAELEPFPRECEVLPKADSRDSADGSVRGRFWQPPAAPVGRDGLSRTDASSCGAKQ